MLGQSVRDLVVYTRLKSNLHFKKIHKSLAKKSVTHDTFGDGPGVLAAV